MAIRGRSFPLRVANIGTAAAAAAPGPVTADFAGIGALTATVATSRAATAALTGAGTLTATVSNPAATRFVDGIDATGRFFVDQNGDPLLIKGYFAWSGVADWSSSQADTFFSHVQAQGGNAVVMEAVSSLNDGGGPNASGATYDGIAPFTGGVVTAFNSTYWSRVDSFLDKAEAAGITVVLYAMDGWNTLSGQAFDGANNTACQAYGNTLATRYLSQPNIMWCFGGDYTPDGGTIDGQFNACLTGIRAAGDNRPASIQLSYYKSLSTDSSYWESRVQYNFVYTYYVQYKGVLDGYRRTPGARDPRPSMWVEGRYEGEGGAAGEPTVIPEVFRKQEMWALTSGSPGVFYGSADWAFPSGWEGRLGTTTEDQLQSTREWFEGLAWHTLVPDDLSAVVTAGRGTKITTDSATWPGSNDYVTAARSGDGALIVAYVPSNSGNTARTLTLDPAKLPTSNRVSLWVDPTNAASTQTATITSNQVTTPGTHSDGTRDWLLLITGDPPSVTAPFNGSGSLTAAVASSRAATGAFTGAGSLAATVSTTREATASLSGTGTLTATSAASRATTVALAGDGTLTATVSTSVAAAAPLNGAGTLAASVTTSRVTTAGFAGDGNLTATYTTSRTAAAGFTGDGALTATAGTNGATTAPFSGVGTLTATVTTARAVTVGFTGDGSLTSAAETARATTAGFTGAGSLTASLISGGAVPASFSGTGSLTAVASTSRAVTVALAGDGALTATTTTSRTTTAPTSGVGALTASVSVVQPGAVTAPLNGSGSFTATVSTSRAVLTGFTGAGAFTVSTHNPDAYQVVRNPKATIHKHHLDARIIR